MTVRWWICAEHSQQPSKIVGRDGIPRCPACGRRLEPLEYGLEGEPQKGRRV